MIKMALVWLKFTTFTRFMWKIFWDLTFAKSFGPKQQMLNTMSSLKNSYVLQWRIRNYQIECISRFKNNISSNFTVNTSIYAYSRNFNLEIQDIWINVKKFRWKHSIDKWNSNGRHTQLNFSVIFVVVKMWIFIAIWRSHRTYNNTTDKYVFAFRYCVIWTK